MVNDGGQPLTTARPPLEVVGSGQQQGQVGSTTGFGRFMDGSGRFMVWVGLPRGTTRVGHMAPPEWVMWPRGYNFYPDSNLGPKCQFNKKGSKWACRVQIRK
nr:hypothetical protein [Tanacetum cinerariifolium]